MSMDNQPDSVQPQDEQAATWAALEAQAASQPLTPGQPEPEAAPSCDEEAEAIVDLIAEGVEGAFPMLGYKPETRQKVARKLAPVLQKYNLSVKFACEFDLAVTVGALVYQSVKAYKAAQKEPEANANG